VTLTKHLAEIGAWSAGFSALAFIAFVAFILH
jgi:hypothetical protein